MKNKYQEVLDVINQSNDEKFIKSSRAYINEYGKDPVTVIQELVDKETPMKVVKWKLAPPETRCAKCGAGLERYHDYCWGCGRKVDWSDNNED